MNNFFLPQIAAQFSTARVAKSEAAPAEKVDMPEEKPSERPFRKPNLFSAYAESDRDSFKASNQGLNVGLAAFYSLPKLEKNEAEQILAELRSDMDQQWTPSKLVAELDSHIISQSKAKRVIAQAVRNKYRMRQIEGEIRHSMRPSNILIHGKSGSGKTEIFRKIAMIYNAPFIRVEATKYTEVGYHGDDVSNMITDLFKKTQSEIAQKDGIAILKGSKILKDKVDKLILKYIIGPSNEENAGYSEK